MSDHTDLGYAKRVGRIDRKRVERTRQESKSKKKNESNE